ncbi:HAD family hydrolase [Candidatus Roizmanbacteria bacterium]|nr:HAD family hydrolase [Candidatus Roizmanbacteria bacterium]
MRKSKISAICFDMWGTLYEGGGSEEWVDLQQNLGALSVEKKTFYKLGLDNLLLRSWPLRDGIRHLAYALNLKINNETVEKVYKSWWQIVKNSKPYPETIEVLKKVKRMNLRLIIISNTDSESFYFKIKEYNLKKYFEKFFISAEIGSLKHEGKMFELAQDYLSVPKNQVLMLDDSLQHGVIPARNFGWQALWLAREKAGKDRYWIENLKRIFDFL